MTDLDLEVNKKFLIVKYARLLNHLDKVCVNCRKIALKLIEEGNFDLAHELIILGQQHDISKFYGSEWKYLCEYDLHMDNPEKLVAIKEHVENNSHHPEFYNTIHDMPDSAIAEMVADWAARGEEFNKPIRQFLEEKAFKKYNFDETSDIFKKMNYYYKLLTGENI